MRLWLVQKNAIIVSTMQIRFLYQPYVMFKNPPQRREKKLLGTFVGLSLCSGYKCLTVLNIKWHRSKKNGDSVKKESLKKSEL